MRDRNLAPTESQVEQAGNEELGAPDKESGEVTKTGTTTVGIAVDDGVVIATDRRASMGRFVSSKKVVKVEQIHPTAAMTLVGSVGGAQSFIKHMELESSLYESRRRRDIPVSALAEFAANLARNGRFFHIHPILGGVDNDGSHVFTIDPAGGKMKHEFASTGSGSRMAYSVLDENYSEDMSFEEAENVACRAVISAAQRDSGSGDGLVVARITEDGVEREMFDDLPEASEFMDE